MFGGFATNVKTTGYELTGDLGKCLRMGGLTFYKDFTKSGSLDADFALGSRKATYTSTSGVPTIGANGYAATTANDDVLKYEIARNRTAAQETIVIKFMPNWNSVDNSADSYLLRDDSTNGGRRFFHRGTTKKLRIDGKNGVIGSVEISDLVANTSTIDAGIIQSINPFTNSYHNGNSENVSATDWTSGFAFDGTYFYIGSDNAGSSQLNGSIAWIKIFNRALTAAEVALVV